MAKAKETATSEGASEALKKLMASTGMSKSEATAKLANPPVKRSHFAMEI